jgi:hypothetical protein
LPVRLVRSPPDQENDMQINAITAFAVMALAATVSAVAYAEEHRELGPHVHGHGNLNIAVEDKRVSMELEVPGIDIVGFEHDATTDDQKAVVEKAKAQLAQPRAVFKLPAAAGCTVADAKVAVEAEHHHDGDADDDHDHDQAAGEDHDHDEHEGHKEFHVTYTLDCAKPASITAIDFDYFKLFRGAHDLTVNIVTAKAQNTYNVTRDAPSLDLAGIM